MTEFLARLSARKPFLVIGIWAVVALIEGVVAADAEMALGSDPPTDFLDKATTTEFQLSGSAG